jgi:hypothetical protein
MTAGRGAGDALLRRALLPLLVAWRGLVPS